MASSVDLFNCSISCWDELSIKAHKSVVFIDNICAECLHWHGGALLFFNAGALDVKEYSAFEYGLPQQKKGVFIFNGALVDANRSILQHIVEASQFENILVVSNLHPSMHTIIEYGPGESDEMRAFSFYRKLVHEWSDDKARVDFIYMPLVAAPIVPNLFVLPGHHDLLPLLPHEIHHIFTENQNQPRPPLTTHDVGYEHLSREIQLELKLLVCSLHGLLGLLSLSDDVYCLGHTSRMVATELASLPWARTRRKNCERKASLLLIDRTLDIASATGHHGETILDKILGTLPKLPEQHCDVAVNLASLCHVASNPDFSVVLPGCLSHPDDGASTSLLGTVSTTKFKECMMEMNRQLVEAANREKLPIKLGRMTKVSVDTLQSHVSHFEGKMTAIRRNCGLLQLVLATIQSLKSPKSAVHDSLLAVEKGLLQVLGDDSGADISPLSQLAQTLQRENKKPKEERLYSIQDILVLLLFVYSSAGSDCYEDPEEEDFLKTVLDAILQESDYKSIPGFVGDDLSEKCISSVIDDFFVKLNSLAAARDDLKYYKSTFDAGSLTSQACLKPLLKQVINDILDPSKTDLADIENRSSGFKDLLKSGFGLFRAATKPHPRDNPLLIIFVIGGVTPTEARQIKEAASKSSMQVMVGGTCLLSPTDVLQKIMCQASRI